VHCVGVEFVEQLEHLTTMLCENLDLAMLKKMFSAFNASKTRKRKKATKIGEVAAMQFIPAGNERKRTKRLRQYISTAELSI
jgi:hypothetical protein